jgi:hypothetical protein
VTENDASAGRLWLVLFAATAFGVLGLVVFAGHWMTGAEHETTCDAVLVEDVTGSGQEALEQAKKYLYSPGADFSDREAARIGAASKHRARRLDPRPGRELSGTELPKTPEAIRQALDELAPGQHVHWSWERREDGAGHPARHVVVARTDDERYHVKVEDIACGSPDARDEPRAPH